MSHFKVIRGTRNIYDNGLGHFNYNNTGDAKDAGIILEYTNSGKKYAGLFRDATDKKWKLLKNMATPNFGTDIVDVTAGVEDTLVVGILDLESTGDILLGSNVNVTPTASNAIATKAYVDANGGSTTVLNEVTGVPSTNIYNGYKEQTILTGTSLSSSANSGNSVAISQDGNYMICGAPVDDNGGTDQGSAHVFVQAGGTWTEQEKISPTVGENSSRFGTSVSISADGVYAVVGASDHDNGNTNQGLAYVFVRDGATWTQQQVLTPSDNQDSAFFGNAIDISANGQYVIVGSSKHNGGSTDEGKAYIFIRNNTTWTEQQILTAAGDAENGAQFGQSVAISALGDYAVVGSHLHNNTSTDRGKAYVFIRSNTTWTQQGSALVPDDPQDSAQFGYAVDITDDANYIVVSSPLWDNTTSEGKIYIYYRLNTTWTQQQAIAGPAANDLIGQSVSFDKAGKHLAVGTSRSSNAGSVIIYIRENDTWTLSEQIDASDTTSSYLYGSSVNLSGNANFIAVGSPGHSTNVGKSYVLYSKNIVMNGMTRINNVLEFADVSAPSNPDDNFGKLYKKSGNDGLFWLPDSAGAEIDLTDGSSISSLTSGRIPYVDSGGLADTANLLWTNGSSLMTIAGELLISKETSNLIISSGTASGTSIASGATNNIILGNAAGNALTTEDGNILMGLNAGEDLTANNCVLIGTSAGLNATDSDNSIFIGRSAGGVGIVTGANNIAIGHQAGEDLTSGNNNVLMGTQAGLNMTDAANCVVVGPTAANAAVSSIGDSCIVIGHNAAGAAALQGTDNIVIGQLAGNVLDAGDHNILIGHNSGLLVAAGINNTCIGKNAGDKIAGGDNNICIGNVSGDAITSGNENVSIGNASDVAATLNNQIAIGYQATCDAANQVTIGNSSVSVLRTGGDGVCDLGQATKKFNNAYVNTLQLRDTAAAFDLAVVSTSATVLTAARTLTIDVNDGNRILDFDANITITGGNNLTLTTTGATNVTFPTTGTLATQAYVDATAQGLSIKECARAATTSQLSGTGYAYTNNVGGNENNGRFTWTASNGPTTLDGVTLANDDRILVKDNTNADENGIYVRINQDQWDRADDFDGNPVVQAGSFFFVCEGTVNGDNSFVLTSDGVLTIGGASGDDLIFTQFAGAGDVIAGTGLTKSGNTINAVGSTNSIHVEADNIQVKSSGTVNEVLLSSGTTTNEPSWGGLPLGDSNAVSGLLPTSSIDDNAVTTVTSTPVTPASTNKVLVCNSGSSVINLPAVTSGKSKQYVIINNKGSGTITINRNGSDTIDGNTSHTLNSQYDRIRLVSDGINDGGNGRWYSL